ncbi:hypothetical protein C4J84_4780 [Pseudomonas sp. R11-23-07]|nr:hypothetical protein C4J84_4780 [Pseudomonas sp. R11-23-07]
MLKPCEVLQEKWGQNVGGGLLPMALCRSAHLTLIHLYREQAPSHI